jgi:hypothetical protein
MTTDEDAIRIANAGLFGGGVPSSDSSLAGEEQASTQGSAAGGGGDLGVGDLALARPAP